MKEIADENTIQKIISQQKTTHKLEKIWSKDHHNTEGQEKRLSLLRKKFSQNFDAVSNNAGIDDLSDLQGHIENFIGFSKVPTGIT